MTSSDETVLDDEAIQRTGRSVGALHEGSHDGRGLKVAILGARFNGGVTVRLLEGCLAGLTECGVDSADITIGWVPGAFELPVAAQAFATASEGYDAVVTLGAVIRGETGHYEFVAGECARGIQDVSLETGVPVVFGVLTCETVEQALERSAPDESNKGRESAITAIEMARLLEDRRLA
jgi:6,7-dimethyl-8-ribityllumazine synthase